MLSRPEHGWATVTIGGYALEVSHIQPVPEMLLTAFIRALSTGGTADVTFDAEGFRWRMEAGAETRLTIMARQTETHVAAVSVEALARAALGDIRRDMDAWSLWGCTPEAEPFQQETLFRLCSQLETCLTCP